MQFLRFGQPKDKATAVKADGTIYWNQFKEIRRGHKLKGTAGAAETMARMNKTY